MEWLYLNGFILVIPILFIRYGVIGMVNKQALAKAFYAPPVKEKYAHLTYNISVNIMLFYMFFLIIKYNTIYNIFGFIIYTLGLILYLISAINFSKHELNTNGLYKISRNPMYLSFFITFFGCSLITNSLILFVILFIHQISAHYIIKAEEIWCINTYGDKYIQYMKKVKRYI